MTGNGENTRGSRLRTWSIQITIPVLAALAVGWLVYLVLSAYVMSEAEENVKNVLLSHRAVHLYIQNIVHPAYYRACDRGEISRDFYSPEILSSSFAVRVLHTFDNEERVRSGLPEIYYKLASGNPRNPVNRADELETGIIRMFNEHPEKREYRRIVQIKGKDYLYYAIPFLKTSAACLRCHGDRSEAPEGLRRIYRGAAGFNERVGQIRAIESIRVPLEKENFVLAVATPTFSAFLIAGLSLAFFNRKLRDDIGRRTEELNAERGRAQTYLDTVEAIIVALDREGNIEALNRKGCELLGYREEELRGRSWFDTCLPEPEGTDEKRSCFGRLISGEGEFKEYCEENVMTRTGGVRLIAWHNSPLRDRQGRTIGVLSAGMDVTEARHAESERAELETQLHQAQKMESIGLLAGGVAHDFNNKLSVILGYTDLALLKSDRNDPIHKQLQAVHEAAESSATLTRQLLAFARKQHIIPIVLDLNDAIGGMLNILRRLIGENIELDWIPGKELWNVKMDPMQIDQVMTNLCVNARDAIEGKRGKLTVRTENRIVSARNRLAGEGCPPGDYVSIVVTDTGHGMDKETLDKIFEPFFTTKAKGYGTGLGLATVFGITKQNNGHISVRSKPGVGSTFTIYLPRHRGDHPTEAPGSDEMMRGNESILLVEDEQSILDVGKCMLESLGYRVTAVSSQEEAVRLVGENAQDFRLVITDVVMPEIDGRELLDRLAAIRPGLKCLFMSGYTADIISRHGVLEEGFHFIQKPFVMKELAAKVRHVLDAP